MHKSEIDRCEKEEEGFVHDNTSQSDRFHFSWAIHEGSSIFRYSKGTYIRIYIRTYMCTRVPSTTSIFALHPENVSSKNNAKSLHIRTHLEKMMSKHVHKTETETENRLFVKTKTETEN